MGNIRALILFMGICMAGLNDLVADGGKLAVPSLSSSIGGSTNKELMADARTSLSGRWGTAMLGYVLYGLLILSFMIFLVSALLFICAKNSADSTEFMMKIGMLAPVLALVEFLLSGPIMVGFVAFFLGISQAGDVRMDLLFAGFKRFWKSIGVYLFFGLFVFLWSLLLVVPGIIAAFRYAMAYYVIADDEDCGPLEALSRSKEMMKGHKWKFFCLHWRFFGWTILCSIIPIGWLWLVPYMRTSYAKFYEDVS